ncbi:hypothetical protein PVAND_002279 [Polypedilum vanderplanki]|uniref:Endonuclease/exonuclease/phosphatase domain-containing protein n=1 Tax=Polypedilum vanderplanki TaxID=319348 RepID=A0A9J6BQH8_POLVA|nr:hypothetical protein PVAND_002279 [Polypedilum vanderplanki]
MSQIKKSASFRSRIPVRKQRLQQRRCSSPHLITSSSASRLKSNNKANQKIFFDRFYSSSSFSSSDESNDQEEPLQMLLKKSTTIDKSTLPNDPADAMSLNGFLDNVSCENLSSPHSPQMRINRLPQQDDKFMQKRTAHSSYESLDKFNSTSETLKITDDYHLNKQNIISRMNRHSSNEIINTTATTTITQPTAPINSQITTNNNNNNNYRLMNGDDYNSSLKKNKNHSVINYDPNGIACDDENEAALNKQKQLSDWYYIKSSPKPKPASPYERRKVKNFSNFTHQKSTAAIPLQPPLLQQNGSFDVRNSTDQINYMSDSSFPPLQKYRSNDYIEPTSQLNDYIEEKSPLHTYKCFSMKYSKNPSGKSFNETSKFGELTSSSFEHVNVTGLYDNRYSENDIRNEDYVQSLRIAAAKMRPLPQVPMMNKQQFLQYQFLRIVPENVIQITLHNTQSIRKHITTIVSDQVFMNSNIVTLQECWAVDNESYNIPDFEEISRNRLMDNRLTIINIYNNPSSSLDLLKETLLEVKDYIDESENILILGDFNHELKLGSPLESFMLQSFGTRLFSPRESTTNARTVIDGVFGRIEDYNVEVFIYESYASHHKPLVMNYKISHLNTL